MITLRVELSPSLAGVATDPGGIFWEERVTAWRDSFIGTAYVNLDQARVTTLPARAVCYIGTPDNVTERNLQYFQQFWSDRVNFVTVKGVRIVPGVADESEDETKLGQGGIADMLGKLGDGAGKVVTIVAIGAAVALVLYAFNKSGGTKSWR